MLNPKTAAFGSVTACALALAVYFFASYGETKCLSKGEIGEVAGTEWSLVKVKRNDGTTCVYEDYDEWRILKPGDKIKGPK
jgi:hypothetical protein